MNRREFIGTGLSALAWTAFGGVGGGISALEEAKRWFKAAQYGMMVHWGLYSLIGGEWKGRLMDERYIGEWAQQYFRIPECEYARLASAFNPVAFSAAEWVKVAQDAGMKYLVFTSKHHDGFAMYRSKVSKFNVVDATPFKRDVVEELAEACRKHGMRFGLYYSQDLDWSDPDGGGYKSPHDWCGGAAGWTNDWDWPDAAKKDYTRYFERKARPQVEEILTQYGDLCLIWFDTPMTISAEQSRELYNLVRKHQPGCLINSRLVNSGLLDAGLGKDACDYESAADNAIPEDDKSGRLFETPATLNDTWGYKPHDQNWKSPERICEIREHLRTRGANYLLNVGPDPLGRIPAKSVEILRKAAPHAQMGA